MSISPQNFDLYDAELRLAMLTRVLNSGDQGIINSSEDDQKFIEAVVNEHPASVRDGYRLHLEEEAENEVELARQAHRGAVLLASYTVFEYAVVRFAESYLLKCDTDLRMRDIAGSGYEKFIVVADKIARKRRHNIEVWEKANDLRQIRNLFAHSNGLIFNPDEKNKIEKALSRLGSNNLVKDGGRNSCFVELDTRFITLFAANLYLLIDSAYWTLFGEDNNAHP